MTARLCGRQARQRQPARQRQAARERQAARQRQALWQRRLRKNLRRQPWKHRQRQGDRGSASVWAAVCAALLCTVLAALLALAQAVAVRHRAGGAADLSALAAAGRAPAGAEPACAAARRVAADQGARLVRCQVGGEIADLTVQVRAGPLTARVRARAGPAAAAE